MNSVTRCKAMYGRWSAGTANAGSSARYGSACRAEARSVRVGQGMPGRGPAITSMWGRRGSVLLRRREAGRIQRFDEVLRGAAGLDLHGLARQIDVDLGGRVHVLDGRGHAACAATAGHAVDKQF